MDHNKWMEVWTLAQYPLLVMAMILAGCLSTCIIVTVRQRLSGSTEGPYVKLGTAEWHSLNLDAAAAKQLHIDLAFSKGERIALQQKVKDLQNSIQKLLDADPDEDEDLGGDLMSAVIRRDPHYGTKRPSKAWCRVCGSNAGDCPCIKNPHAVYEGGLPPPTRPPEPFN